MYILNRSEVAGKKRNVRRYYDVGVFRKRTHIFCCGSWVGVSQTGFRRGVLGVLRRRKCVMAEEFYWRSEICM
jgi:hypothetical protein